jgi:hypothetical protein
MTPKKPENDFATVKVKRPFLRWLQRESLRRDLYIYDFLEEIAIAGFKKRSRRAEAKR